MDYETIGRQFGLDAQQTQAAFEALAPVVAAGMRRNAASDGGLADLIGALAGGGHARYAGDPSVLAAPETIDDGNAILGHVFGSKEVSRGVAQQLSAETGIGAAILKKMLPVIAAVVMGQLARKAFGGAASGSGGGLGDILGQVLGGGTSAQAPGGGLGDILGGILGGQGGQGQAQGGGLGDILGQVLGGGGGAQTGRQAPGGLEDMLREVLGGGASPEAQETVTQTRRSLDDILGGGSSRGSAAEDLLSSVERALRR